VKLAESIFAASPLHTSRFLWTNSGNTAEALVSAFDTLIEDVVGIWIIVN
jgi:hypothetical protein